MLQITIRRYAAVMIVSIGNILLRFVLKRATRFEKRLSKTKELASLLVKLFLAEFTNSVIVFVWLYITGKQVWILNSFSIRRDLNSQFYRAIGSTLVLVVVSNIVLLCVYPFLEHAWHYICIRIVDRFDIRGRARKRRFREEKRIRRCRFLCDMFTIEYDECATHAKDQTEYDNMLLGPKLQLAEYYAVILNITFISLIFFTALPVILPLVGIGLCFAFVSFKFAYLRLYRLGSVLHCALARVSGQILCLGAICHAFASVWLLSGMLVEDDNVIPSVSTRLYISLLRLPHMLIFLVYVTFQAWTPFRKCVMRRHDHDDEDDEDDMRRIKKRRYLPDYLESIPLVTLEKYVQSGLLKGRALVSFESALEAKQKFMSQVSRLFTSRADENGMISRDRCMMLARHILMITSRERSSFSSLSFGARAVNRGLFKCVVRNLEGKNEYDVYDFVQCLESALSIVGIATFVVFFSSSSSSSSSKYTLNS